MKESISDSNDASSPISDKQSQLLSITENEETTNSNLLKNDSLPSLVTPLLATTHNNKVNNDGETKDQTDVSYTLPKLELPPHSNLEPIETFVMNAIQSQYEEKPNPAYKQGYRAICDALRRPIDPPMVHKVLIALRTAGSGRALNLLTSDPVKHAHLTHLIMRFVSTKPPKGFQDFVQGEGNDVEELIKVYEDCSILDAHLHLILALVSAKSVNLVPALNAIWKMLALSPSNPEPVLYRLHAMLFTLMRICPKARTEFFPVLATKFPFWTLKTESISWYCMQCFKVVEYLPSIRKKLLEIIVDKCLEMDVNIKIKDNGEVHIEDENVDADRDGQEQQQSQQEGVVSKSESGGDAVDELSDKLDSILALLFDSIQKSSNDGASVREIYYEILPIFESTILTTHKSKFVQYCLFLLCGLESQLISEDSAPATPSNEQYEHAILHRDFAAKLLEIIVDPYLATLTRQSGACYLASFISRASYVGPETVCESVSALLRWAEAYIETVVSIRAADSREQSELHGLFYTICQAAFYIMSFRGPEAIQFYRDALSENTGGTEMPNHNERFFMPDPEQINLGTKRWTAICSHELQPLRFCLESVRSEFLHVAHAFDLIGEPVLNKLVVDAKRLSTGRVNKKAASKISTAATLEKQRQTGGVGGLGRGSNPLKSFFPFDPLLLRRSHDYIEEFYKHWQGPCQEEDVLVIDDSSEPGEDSDFEMEQHMDASDDEDDVEEDNVVEDDAEEEDVEEDDDEFPVIVSDQDDILAKEDLLRTPDVQQKKEMQRRAWTETLKRPRSLSIENGSW